jgi:DNA-directed RNA polymerase subunit omega
MIDGKAVLTDAETDKPVSIAANEIAEDLITYQREV